MASQNSVVLENASSSDMAQIQAPDPPQAAADASQAPITWTVPPQQVCQIGATPTNVCGKYSQAKNDPPKKPSPRGGTGPYKCPRCEFGYSRIDSVRQHFPLCVATNGNPNCDSWTDDESYAAGVADRTASRAKDKDTAKERKPRTKAVHLVTLTPCELIIRLTAHGGEGLFALQPSGGEDLASFETEEGQAKCWETIRKNLKEETRNAQEISPEAEYVINSFKEEGVWDSEPSDEA